MQTSVSLNDLIAGYREMLGIYQADETDDETKYADFQRAEEALIAYRCQSIEEIKAKAAFIISDANILDTVKECWVIDGSEDCLTLFLRSLLGEAP